MSTMVHDAQTRLRQTVYVLLVVASTGMLLGRILAVDSVDRSRAKRPFLSANDRSRWCTVRALVEPAMRVPGAPYAIDKVVQQPGWDTIDMVKHDGHLYSSKPPLLATLMAVEYWLIYHLTGLNLGQHPYEVGRFMLITINLVPLVVYWFLLARLVERLARTDWARLFVMVAACFGTFLTTFAVAITNHLVAAISALVALDAGVRIWFDGRRDWRDFAVAGLFAAFAAVNELPAAAFCAVFTAALVWRAPARALAAYVPAALVVVAALLATNWVAHRSLRLPYAHRSTTDPADNWYRFTYQRGGRELTSYWENPVGIDRGEPSRATYALHVLVGHHGIFSLTPIWVLSAIGLGLWLARAEDVRTRQLAAMIAGVSVVCLVFYLARPQADRNYGGMTSGFRWMFWLAPMWLLGMIPALDAMASRRVWRALALVALAVSALSGAYPTWNPWTHPWLYNWMHYWGWISH